MSTLERAREWAKSVGCDGVEKIALTSGATVYLLQGKGNIGLPRYLKPSGETFEISSYEESVALLSEPDYLRDDD